MTHLTFTPREIVSELDRYIVGQDKAKRAVAIALRNRWRRQQLPESLREEVLPKNILMIGPTGVGKTEIARRLSKLAEAPFTKVEATKFTEVGYVGRDVEQIIRDLVDVAITMTREKHRREVSSKAELNTEEKILDAIVGKNSMHSTRQETREKLRRNELEEKEIVIQVPDNKAPHFPMLDVPGGHVGMVNLGELLNKSFPKKTKFLKMRVKEARPILFLMESDNLLDEERIVYEAIKDTQENGIVFIDEIDKICTRSDHYAGGVSREGVQRDLLPLLEGTTVSTKYGYIKTDHILFIASGAFHIAKPSDLLPELQGRLPNRVEMSSLTEEDFIKILTEPEASLIKQYMALLSTEELTLKFEESSIKEIARLATKVRVCQEFCVNE